MSMIWKFPGEYLGIDVGEAGIVVIGGKKLILLNELASIKWSVDGEFQLARIWEGCVMAAGGDEVACLAVEDGSEIWRKKLDGRITCMELKDKAYIGTERGVYALNKAGRMVWSYETGEVKEIRVKEKVYVLTEKGVICLDDKPPSVGFPTNFQPPEPENPEELSGEGEWIPGMDGIYG